jgi:hypothetical protein
MVSRLAKAGHPGIAIDALMGVDHDAVDAAVVAHFRAKGRLQFANVEGSGQARRPDFAVAQNAGGTCSRKGWFLLPA